MDCEGITTRIGQLQEYHKDISLLLSQEKTDELFDRKDRADLLVFEILAEYYTKHNSGSDERKYRFAIDHRDLVAKQFDYDTVGKFVDGVAFAQNRNKDGQGWEDTSYLIDEFGKVVKVFENVEEILGFENGVCWLCIFSYDKQGEYQSKYIMIDKTGQTLATVARIDRENRHNGIFAVSDEKENTDQGNWYFLKADGTRLDNRNFYQCLGFSGSANKGWAMATINSSPMVVSRDGMDKTIIGTFEETLRFGPDIAWMRVAGFRYKLFSGITNTFLSDPRSAGEITAEWVFPFSAGWGGYREGGKYYFVNEQFKKIGPYKQIRSFAASADGRLAAAPVKCEDGKWYLIEGENGTKLMEEGYEEIGGSHEEPCWAKIKEGEYCFLGLDGKEPAAFAGKRFRSVGLFSDGVGSVMDENGVWHEIDRLGRYVFGKN